MARERHIRPRITPRSLTPRHALLALVGFVWAWTQGLALAHAGEHGPDPHQPDCAVCTLAVLDEWDGDDLAPPPAAPALQPQPDTQPEPIPAPPAVERRRGRAATSRGPPVRA